MTFAEPWTQFTETGYVDNIWDTDKFPYLVRWFPEDNQRFSFNRAFRSRGDALAAYELPFHRGVDLVKYQWQGARPASRHVGFSLLETKR